MDLSKVSSFERVLIMKNFIDQYTKRPNICLLVGLIDQFHITSVFFNQLWRNVMHGPNHIFSFALILLDLCKELHKSDVLIKIKQIKNKLLLGMFEYFFQNLNCYLWHAIINDFDVQLLVNHNVLGLNLSLEMVLWGHDGVFYIIDSGTLKYWQLYIGKNAWFKVYALWVASCDWCSELRR